MGLFSKKSNRTTVNEDNRIINDLSGSTFDNSVDSSQSYEDSSYKDNSQHFTDNGYSDSSQSYEDSSYSDTSQHFTDESYTDSSTTMSGEYAGNTGSIQITDGGAFTTVDNAVSEFVSLGQSAIGGMTSTTSMSLSTMGKTAETSMQQATMNSELMRDVAAKALEEMSDQAASTVSASTQANREALASSQKLMTTISADGNDLLIDGVVKVAKYGVIGFGVIATVFTVAKIAGGNK